VRPAAAAHFASVLGAVRWVRDICVCTQLGEADFLIAERMVFAGGA
jgi:hypothetical protein